MIVSIHHVQITIPPGAEAEARDFYCGVLGLHEIPKPESLAGRGGLWVSVGDRDLHLGVEDGVDRTQSKTHVAYRVPDLKAAVAQLANRGVELMDAPPIPGFDRTQFRDPFGNLIELIQPLGTMMLTYNVFFSPRADAAEDRVVALCREFFTRLRSEDRIAAFRLLRVTNAASFTGMPRFHLIVDYRSQEQLDESFAHMKTEMETPPHGDLMKMVEDFRVTFSEDVTIETNEVEASDNL